MERASSPDGTPELPRLSPGVWLLETGDRDVAALGSLAIDHLLLEGGTAVWIDARGYGRSQVLREIAPAPRVLDRILIARGFTAFQHASIAASAADAIDDRTALLVAPAVDSLYRDDDVRGVDPQDLLLRTLARLAGYARAYDVPVLLTRTGTDRLGRVVTNLAQETIAVERTRFGPRFVADGFETLVYPAERGLVQTTLAFWARVLEARRPCYPTGALAATPAAPTAAEVGHGAH